MPQTVSGGIQSGGVAEFSNQRRGGIHTCSVLEGGSIQVKVYFRTHRVIGEAVSSSSYCKVVIDTVCITAVITLCIQQDLSILIGVVYIQRNRETETELTVTYRVGTRIENPVAISEGEGFIGQMLIVTAGYKTLVVKDGAGEHAPVISHAFSVTLYVTAYGYY